MIVLGQSQYWEHLSFILKSRGVEKCWMWAIIFALAEHSPSTEFAYSLSDLFCILVTLLSSSAGELLLFVVGGQV